MKNIAIIFLLVLGLILTACDSSIDSREEYIYPKYLYTVILENEQTIQFIADDCWTHTIGDWGQGQAPKLKLICTNGGSDVCRSFDCRNYVFEGFIISYSKGE